ncbi:MAG: hypothetical protein R6U66_08170 [Bacteroidales bacterium]
MMAGHFFLGLKEEPGKKQPGMMTLMAATITVARGDSYGIRARYSS